MHRGYKNTIASTYYHLICARLSALKELAIYETKCKQLRINMAQPGQRGQREGRLEGEFMEGGEDEEGERAGGQSLDHGVGEGKKTGKEGAACEDAAYR